MQAHKLAVLATVNPKGLPEAAVIGFSENDKFEIFFGTSAKSRKYKNLSRNGHIAMVIGWDQGKTVQLEGIATEVTDEKEIEEYRKVHLAKIPSAAKFMKEADEAFFQIKPSFVRFSDLSKDPWDVEEIHFMI